jgi:hypothetical protein
MSVDVGAEFFLDLGQKVGDVHKHMLKSHKPLPVRKPVGGSVNIPATVPATAIILTEQFPTVGRVWNVLKVAVFGADAHTSISNVNVDVYAGTNPDPGNPALTDVILSGLAVPSITQFSKEVEWVYPGQQPFALIYGSGLAAGQNYELILRVAEYRAVDVEARMITP